MKRTAAYLVLATTILLTSCTGYSTYAIDERPQLEIDHSLLGIWKAVEDTNKLDFILVQSYHKVFQPIVRKYGSVINYIEDNRMKTVQYDTAEAGKTYEEDMQEYNDREKLYYLTRFNQDGLNPWYQQWDAFLSEVAGSRFLNITYRNKREEGYMLHRIMKVSRDTMAVAIVVYPAMKNLPSSVAVRKMLEQNINNRSFYGDTVHFFRVKGGELGLNEAVVLANPLAIR